MSIVNDSQKVAGLLLESGAVSFRPEKPYRWASGMLSPVYCDNRLILSDPKARDAMIKFMEGLIHSKKINFETMAGVAMAGIPHAAILADRLGKPLIYVRASAKDHGKGNKIEGRLARGDRVLVVEDLVSTGGSSLSVVEAIRSSGGKVADCLAVFSYGFPFAANAFKRARCQLHALTGLDVLLNIAIKTKKLDPASKRVIEEFRCNPRQWSDRLKGG